MASNGRPTPARGGAGYYGGGRLEANDPFSQPTNFGNFQYETAAAAGGSGYVAASAIAGQILSTPDGTITPPNDSDSYYVAGIGTGSTSSAKRAGGNGLAVLCWEYPTDYSDAPITGTNYGEATHTIVTGLQLGTNNDAETASIANADASGDNADDGITACPAITYGHSSYAIDTTTR